MLQSDPGPAAHFPVSALATRWGLGGALGFVPLKASRMGGTTTGNIMPVDGDANMEKSPSVWEEARGAVRGFGRRRQASHSLRVRTIRTTRGGSHPRCIVRP